MAVADYVGRRSDINVFLGGILGGPVLLEEALYQETSPSGERVTGVQKLAQRFLIKLLKPLGSDASRPQDGSLFLQRIFSGNYRTAQRSSQVFAESVLQITPGLREEETTEMPLDEQFESATLTGVSFPGEGSIQLAVLLRSRAGSSFTFIAPLAA
jgi:hypothetical protein